MKFKHIALALITMAALGCKQKPPKKAIEKKKADSAQLISTNILEDWKCDSTGDDVICHPPKWTALRHSGNMLASYVGENDISTVFAVTREKNVDMNSYLKNVYEILKADTLEQVDGYTVNKLTYQNKVTYFAKYYTQGGGVSSLSYAMMFELDNNIYEVGLKFKKADWKKFSAVFQKILGEYRHKGKQFFDDKDKIRASENIDLSKM